MSISELDAFFSESDLNAEPDTTGKDPFKLEADLRAAPAATGQTSKVEDELRAALTAGTEETPEPDGPTLQDMRLLKIAVSWQEAVAVMLECLHNVSDRGAFPDPARVRLTPIGEARVLSGPALPGLAVPHAAGFLKDLMGSAAAPADLLALLEVDSSKAPEHASLAAFARALAYFERPNRRADVAAVYTRARAVHLKAVADRELERLRFRAGRPAPDGGAAQVRTERLNPELLNRALVAGMCILIGLSAIALVSVALAPGPQPVRGPASPIVPPAAALVTPPAEDTAPAGEIGLPEPRMAHSDDAPAPSVPRTPARQPASPPKPETVETANEDESPEPSVALRPSGGWSVSIREVTDAPTLVQLTPVTEESTGDSEAIYSRLDTNVEPASLMRPQLPSSWNQDAPGDLISLFELIVSRSGDVEQVRLVSPGNRFSDKMLIAAAKAWQFQPALREGRPVRYRLSLRISP